MKFTTLWLALGCFAVNAEARTPVPVAALNTPTLSSATAASIINGANAFRASQGLGSLANDESLANAAQEFAAYMAETDKFSHTADNRDPGERISAQGYVWATYAENIAYECYPNLTTSGAIAREFMQDWENSPGHRANLLNQAVTQIGVGVARDARGCFYAVQDFATPQQTAGDTPSL